MNKRKRIIRIVAGILIIIFIGIFVSEYVNKEKNIYVGNGFPYILGNGKKSQLTVYNENGIYKEKLGRKKDIFWFASSVYDEETISVDNRDRIYRFTKDRIDTFKDIEANIMAVLKVNGNYLVINEMNNSVCINLYSENFENKLDFREVSGTFENCFVENNVVIYSVRGDKESFTGVYTYDPENHLNEQVYFSNTCQEVYPFLYNATLFLVVNKQITEVGNTDVLELYEKKENGEFKKVMDLEEPLKKVLNINGELYGLAGINSTSVLRMNLSLYSPEILFTLDGEEALGLYYVNDKIQVLTNYGIYSLNGNQLLKQHTIDSVELMNVFY